jgi:molybdenum cofactor synthesis domain-containing protein
MHQLKIHSVNISLAKGTVKIPCSAIELNSLGVSGDAHAGKWHRQVSLLGKESIDQYNLATGSQIAYGEFAENITTEGFPLFRMKALDRIVCKDLVLEVTQIGKKCHGAKCHIFVQTGDCVMPKEGIFCRVLSPGTLKQGDLLEYQPKVIRVLVITLSDRASEGIYEDRSGPLLGQLLDHYFLENGRTVRVEKHIIADDGDKLRDLITTSTRSGVDLLFTTGGTGIGERDITPDVVKPMLEKEIPGIMELIRVKYGMQFPNALVSRGVAGIIGKTLIYTLPGNPKAVQEYFDEIAKIIEHSLLMMHGIDTH